MDGSSTRSSHTARGRFIMLVLLWSIAPLFLPGKQNSSRAGSSRKYQQNQPPALLLPSRRGPRPGKSVGDQRNQAIYFDSLIALTDICVSNQMLKKKKYLPVATCMGVP